MTYVKIEIQEVINRLKSAPAALKLEGIDPEKIIVWLTWVIRFIDFYNKTFKNKKGEYRKPWGKAFAIIGQVFSLGMMLIGDKFKK